jgi:hypothetical protein
MLRRCGASLLPKIHGVGHVFWRTKQESPVDRGMKTPLLTERPYPLSEVVRRMVRIRCKFEDSADLSERALLRGEYKYYTGKPCDIRHSDTADLVAVVECSSFFGFWDNKLLRLVEGVLLDRVLTLEPLELMLLFKSLSALSMTGTDLYSDVCDQLTTLAGDGALTFDEIVSLIGAAVRTTPQNMLRHLLGTHILPKLGAIETATQAIAVLRGMSIIESMGDPAMDTRLRDAARSLHLRVIADADDLTCTEIAEAVHYCAMSGVVNPDDDRKGGSLLVKKLADVFVAKADKADGSSVATLVETISAFDDRFVLRISERILRIHSTMSHAQHGAVLEAVSELSNRLARPADLPVVGELLHALIEAHGHVVRDTSYPTDVRAAVRSLETLSRLRVETRKQLLSHYHHAVQQVLSVLVARAPSLSGAECAAVLQSVVRVGISAGDAIQQTVLTRLERVAELVTPDAAATLLSELRAVPPLPTSAARARMQHVVLKAVLDRADGVV